MRLKKNIILTITLAIFLGCKDERKFPVTKQLTEFRQTDFLLTLEHEMSPDRNSVYCVTFLYAWNEVKNSIDSPVQIDKSLHDLNLINKSKYYLGALKDDEYTSSGLVSDQLITARADFKKSLPFELELTSFDKELTFDKKKVPSFGVIGYGYEMTKIIKIVYYKNDNNFIIKLLPKNNEHEIYLFKTETRFKSMSDIVSEIDSKSEIGKIEKQNEQTSWRYYLNDEDEVIIPKFEFNIETNYSTLESKKFQSADNEYEIQTAWQRTAFILDEKGAEVESEALIEVATEELDEEESPRPKKMRFDKPFFLMLKRTDCKYPYFGLWTMNTELMKTE